MFEPSQTTSYLDKTIVIPDPAEYNTRLNLQLNNTILDMHTHPKILGLTLIINSTQQTNQTKQLNSKTSLRPSGARHSQETKT